jgi:siroheme synthase
MVPGATAASGAAAALHLSLTERGVSDTLIFGTGRSRPGELPPDWMPHARPGTALALYMSVGQSSRIAAQLIQGGMPRDTKVVIAQDVSKPTERFVTTSVSEMTAAMARHQITGCAVILCTWPKFSNPAAARRPLAVVAS